MSSRRTCTDLWADLGPRFRLGRCRFLIQHAKEAVEQADRDEEKADEALEYCHCVI